MIGLERSNVRAGRPPREFLKLAPDERHGPLDFQPAHVGAGEDVAGLPGRHRDLGEPEDAGGEILADIAFDSAGPGRWTNHPQSKAVLATDRPRDRRTAPARTLSPKAGWRHWPRPDTLPPGAPATAVFRSSSRSKPTPPGRTRPRPKRLPHKRAVMFRKSPRMRPQ